MTTLANGYTSSGERLDTEKGFPPLWNTLANNGDLQGDKSKSNENTVPQVKHIFLYNHWCLQKFLCADRLLPKCVTSLIHLKSSGNQSRKGSTVSQVVHIFLCNYQCLQKFLSSLRFSTKMCNQFDPLETIRSCFDYSLYSFEITCDVTSGRLRTSLRVTIKRACLPRFHILRERFMVPHWNTQSTGSDITSNLEAVQTVVTSVMSSNRKYLPSPIRWMLTVNSNLSPSGVCPTRVIMSIYPDDLSPWRSP